MRITVRTVLTTVVDVPGVAEFEDAVAAIKHNDFRLPSTDGLTGWELGSFTYAVEGEPEPAPVIEILHQRDPDASCNVSVYLNGEPVEVADEVDIDPGAGWTKGDWEVRIAEMGEANSPFERAAHEALVEARGSKYITEDY